MSLTWSVVSLLVAIAALGVIAFVVSLFCSTTKVSGQGSPNIVWQQKQNSDRINSVVFSPDGGTFITGSSDRLITPIKRST